MSETKEELERQREKLVTKMKEWEGAMAWSRGQIENILGDKRDVPLSEIRDSLTLVRDRLSAASTSVHKSSDNLEYLENFFKFQKSNFEVRKFAFDSWPASRFVEQMLWVATVLISLGGAAFGAGIALAREDLAIALVVPGFFWALGIVLLYWSLSGLRKIDSQKMTFYKREFDIAKDIEQADGPQAAGQK